MWRSCGGARFAEGRGVCIEVLDVEKVFVDQCRRHLCIYLGTDLVICLQTDLCFLVKPRMMLNSLSQSIQPPLLLLIHLPPSGASHLATK